jgi:hypothetical protein
VDRDIFECKLIPANEELEREITISLPTDYGRNRTLSEAVTDFVSYVGRHLAYSGMCIFEIVISTDNDFKAYFNSRWALIDIFPKDTLVIPRWLVQFTQGEARKKNTIPLIFIPKHKCAIFIFPEALGGKHGYMRFLRKLFSTNQIENSTLMMDFSQKKDFNHYDFIVHQKMLEIQRWKLSKFLGWHHRSYLGTSDNGSEYFRWKRLLEFRRSQLIIRDEIITTFKDVISRVGRGLGQEVSIDIEISRKVTDLDDAIQKWEQGDLDFEDINEYLR